MRMRWQCRCMLAFALLIAAGAAGCRQGDRAVSQRPPRGSGEALTARTATLGPPDPGGTRVTGLAWSPSGDRLCVVGDEAGRAGAAVVLDLATGSRQEVALSGWLSPQGWSPDGKEISFLDPTGSVQVLDLDRDQARQVATPAAQVQGELPEGRSHPGWSPPVWSASGQWLAFGAFDDAWVARPDGRGLRQVTQSGWTGAACPYAWSPGGDVLTYGQADAAQHDWSVQGYEAETGRTVSVGGDLGLAAIRALSWQPGGDQLAVVGILSMLKMTVCLIPEHGAVRKLPTALTSVEAMWTGDGRALLIRGATSGTQRLTVDAVEAEGGAVRTLPQTHFLTDGKVTLIAPRPGSDDIAFALGANVYLARADGSRWRRVNRGGPVTVAEMANPLERWERDPVVLAAARRWQRAIPRGQPDASPPDGVVYGTWDHFLARRKTRLLAGERVSYRGLPEDRQREVLTGLVYQTFRNTSVGGDPAAVTVPGWYWWLDEARLALSAPRPPNLVFTLEGPDGDSAAFTISRPQPAGRRGRSVFLHFWWPALLGAAALIVALLGWRQARRPRGRPEQTSDPPPSR
jgi:hypothetical protein